MQLSLYHPLTFNLSQRLPIKMLSSELDLPETELSWEFAGSGPHYEILNFRHRQMLQNQTDVYNILSEYGFLKDHFDDVGIYANQDSSTMDGLGWLASIFPRDSEFWSHARSDLPLQLREGSRDSQANMSISDSAEVEHQLFSKYSDTMVNEVLVRDTLQIMYRRDGTSRPVLSRAAFTDPMQVSYFRCYLKRFSMGLPFPWTFCHPSGTRHLVIHSVSLDHPVGPVRPYTGYFTGFS